MLELVKNIISNMVHIDIYILILFSIQKCKDVDESLDTYLKNVFAQYPELNIDEDVKKMTLELLEDAIIDKTAKEVSLLTIIELIYVQNNFRIAEIIFMALNSEIDSENALIEPYIKYFSNDLKLVLSVFVEKNNYAKKILLSTLNSCKNDAWKISMIVLSSLISKDSEIKNAIIKELDEKIYDAVYYLCPLLISSIVTNHAPELRDKLLYCMNKNDDSLCYYSDLSCLIEIDSKTKDALIAKLNDKKLHRYSILSIIRALGSQVEKDDAIKVAFVNLLNSNIKNECCITELINLLSNKAAEDNSVKKAIISKLCYPFHYTIQREARNALKKLIEKDNEVKKAFIDILKSDEKEVIKEFDSILEILHRYANNDDSWKYLIIKRHISGDLELHWSSPRIEIKTISLMKFFFLNYEKIDIKYRKDVAVKALQSNSRLSKHFRNEYIKRLDHEDVDLKRDAFKVLNHIINKDKCVRNKIIYKLYDSNYKTRQRSIQLLESIILEPVKIQKKEIIPYMSDIEILMNNNDYKGKNKRKKLINILKRKDDEKKSKEAFIVLSKLIYHKDVRDTFIKLLNDPENQFTTYSTVEALMPLLTVDKNVDDCIIKYLDSSNKYESAKCLIISRISESFNQLKSFLPSTIFNSYTDQDIMDKIDSENPYERSSAIAVASENLIESNELKNKIFNQMGDEYSVVRISIAETIGPLLNNYFDLFKDDLIEKLNDSNFLVRWTAVLCFKDIIEDNIESRQYILPMLDDPDEEVVKVTLYLLCSKFCMDENLQCHLLEKFITSSEDISCLIWGVFSILNTSEINAEELIDNNFLYSDLLKEIFDISKIDHIIPEHFGETKRQMIINRIKDLTEYDPYAINATVFFGFLNNSELLYKMLENQKAKHKKNYGLSRDFGVVSQLSCYNLNIKGIIRQFLDELDNTHISRDEEYCFSIFAMFTPQYCIDAEIRTTLKEIYSKQKGIHRLYISMSIVPHLKMEPDFQNEFLHFFNCHSVYDYDDSKIRKRFAKNYAKLLPDHPDLKKKMISLLNSQSFYIRHTAAMALCYMPGGPDKDIVVRLRELIHDTRGIETYYTRIHFALVLLNDKSQEVQKNAFDIIFDFITIIFESNNWCGAGYYSAMALKKALKKLTIEHTFFFNLLKKEKEYQEKLIQFIGFYSVAGDIVEKHSAIELGNLCRKFNIHNVAIACYQRAINYTLDDAVYNEILLYLQSYSNES